MNESKLNKSWEKVRDSIHAPEGVEELKSTVKYGLSKKYAIISETMFEWRFEGEQYQDMQIMSRDTIPSFRRKSKLTSNHRIYPLETMIRSHDSLSGVILHTFPLNILPLRYSNGYDDE